MLLKGGRGTSSPSKFAHFKGLFSFESRWKSFQVLKAHWKCVWWREPGWIFDKLINQLWICCKAVHFNFGLSASISEFLKKGVLYVLGSSCPETKIRSSTLALIALSFILRAPTKKNAEDSNQPIFFLNKSWTKFSAIFLNSIFIFWLRKICILQIVRKNASATELLQLSRSGWPQRGTALLFRPKTSKQDCTRRARANCELTFLIEKNNKIT